MQYIAIYVSFILYKALSPEDVILQIANHIFEAKILLGSWCYNMNIG